MRKQPGTFNPSILLSGLLAAFSETNDGRYYFIYDIQRNMTCWSKSAVHVLGLENDVIEGSQQDWISRVHPEDQKFVSEEIELIRARKKDSCSLRYRVKDHNGTYITCECCGSTIYEGEGEPLYFAGTIINYGIQSRIDTVTGFPNLYAFFNDLKENRKNHKKGTVMLIGSSRFAEINDVYGYSFGNQVLLAFSELLREHFGSDCTIYRMEGVKFAIFSYTRSMEELQREYEFLRARTRQGIGVEECRIHLFLAGGIMPIEVFNISSHTVYSCLLYTYCESKENHQGELVKFHNRISNRNKHWIEELNVIRECVIDGCRGFYLCYQPIVRVKDGSLAGMEALIRWKNETYGEVSPNDFISVLEKDSVFPDLGAWILRQACMDAKPYADKDPAFIVNVNLSYAQIERSNFVDDVMRILEETEYSPVNLCLELTERCRILDEGMLQDKVCALRSQGIRFALDDFGTGYSSLNLLRKMPIDEVKIDRQFIKDILGSRVDQNIINGLTNTVSSTGKSICIEGVENAELKEFLRHYPATYFQGYLYSKPVPIEEFRKLHFKKTDRDQGKCRTMEEMKTINERTNNVILRCAKLLHEEKDFLSSVSRIMTEMSRIIHPDRIYLATCDDKYTSVVQEWCLPGTSRDHSAFQKRPVSRIAWWKDYMDKDGVVILRNSPELKEKDAIGYEVMNRYGIQKIMVVLLYDRDKVIGYFGINNYQEMELINTRDLLQTIALFLAAEMRNENLIGQLTRLSREDQLTGCGNRNAFDEDIQSIEDGEHSLGMIFADLNGLKATNDTYGHARGDQLIVQAADLLGRLYQGGRLYRVGGDEFILTFSGFSKLEFEGIMEERYRRLDESSINISLGWSWSQDAARRQEIQDEAEEMMYQRKAKYYQHHDRRKH